MLAISPLSAGNQFYGFDRIGSEHGLSHNSVYALLQDRHGFVWIGTVDGLNRYDGYRFRVYRHHVGDPDSLSNSVIRCLLEDREGRLWVGTESGLDLHQPRVDGFRPMTIAGHPVGIRALAQSADGHLWAATINGLYQSTHDGETWHAIDLQPGLPVENHSPEVHDIDIGPQGLIWMLVKKPDDLFTVVASYDPSSHEVHWYPVSPPDGSIYSLNIDSEGRIWTAAATAPTPVMAPGSPIAASADPNLGAWAFARSSQGALWIGTAQGVYQALGDQTGFHRLERDPHAFLNNFVRSLLVDSANTLWVGTHGGLYRSRPTYRPFRTSSYDANDPNSLSAAAVASLLEDSDGSLWVGTYGGGLSHISAQGAIERYPHLDSENQSVVWDIERSATGELLLGTPGGLVVFQPATGEFRSIDFQTPDGQDLNIRNIEVDRNGRWWLGTTNGLFVTDSNGHITRTWPPQGELDTRVMGIESLRMQGTTIWIGTQSGILVELDTASGRSRRFDSETRSEGIWDIRIRGDGSLLLATGGGFLHFDRQRELFESVVAINDIPATSVYSVLVDAADHIWLGTGNGLTRISPDGHIRVYHREDGTGITEYNRHAALAMSNGDLVFGGMSGVVRFDPFAIGDNPFAPPVMLTAIEVYSRDGQQSLQPESLDQLLLLPGDTSFSAEFAALNYVNSKRNRYRYRLDGFDVNWIEAGQRRLATYTNLPPGQYRLEVVGSNEDGLWSEQPAVLPVLVLPPYWATWWFRLIISVLVLLAASLAYHLRIRHLLELERMRLRIASDLHDEGSSDLSGIALASDLLSQQGQMQQSARDQLAIIQRTALRTVGNLRDIVWYINPEHDRGASLLERFRTTGQQLLADKDFSIQFNRDLAQAAFDMDLRRNLYLIYKEALHNIVRHAQASFVQVKASRADGVMTLEIMDDGIGIAPDRPHGIGLDSMLRRAKEIGATLEVSAVKSGGTRVRVRVPMARIRDGEEAMKRRRLHHE